ncbi:XRE family transcriptional regulator [Clostridium autoethanogenum]|uniref:HTH-type transcriptional regulator ImmR n=2 Tax=Clostridium TaxID=1485 RepID=A0A1A6B364_9CLOT|nr:MULTISPECIES: helix-turn-helix transcriptional regulator [Clostridium]OBR96718.1 HTH-type transcriptional regulator ImmR [Clostridium ragsdalei P11]RMC93601.1 XRE family transcriptional regulator [Clostridium autoethanogenum]
MKNYTLGNRIRNLREEKSISQLELAKILNIGNTTLSQYESDKRVPSDTVKKKIAEYFGISLDYLMGLTDTKEPKINIPQEYSDKYKVTKKDIEQHNEVIKHAQAFMMDDEVGEEDKEKLVTVINKLYWDAKAKNKEKFGRKKKK